MADEVSPWQMNPDSGWVVDRWAGNEQHLVANMKAVDVLFALTENGAVNGHPEALGAVRRQGRDATSHVIN